jgi:gluconate 5-dehydrogenase
LITGGGTGLGYAMAQCMVLAGAKVAIVGRREEVLREATETLGRTSYWESYDVTEYDQAPKLIERINQNLGPLSILVNNAGMHLKKPAIETTESEFLSVLNTHLMGAYALTRAAAPGMIERKQGSIIFIASMASFFGLPNVAAYTAAKSAYVGLVRALASEFSAEGVRVNAIAPGFIDTHMLHKAVDNDPQRKEKILDRTPMRRFGHPDDIGHAAVYLSSRAGRFVTGTTLPVDGGASIGF